MASVRPEMFAKEEITLLTLKQQQGLSTEQSLIYENPFVLSSLPLPEVTYLAGRTFFYNTIIYLGVLRVIPGNNIKIWNAQEGLLTPVLNTL